MVRIFYSYSHKDTLLREELERHLAMLRRQGQILEWHDRKIDAGVNWKGAIDFHLREAEIILLLVSSDFLASDYCYDVEAECALHRHASGQALLIPVILRPCDWNTTPFGHLQALPREAKPISTWIDRDEAFLSVVQGIRDVVFRHFMPASALKKEPPLSMRESVEGEQERVLDAALPKQVTVGHATELIAMVRRTDSGGLRAYLDSEEDTELSSEDVKSRSFRMDFPLDHGGRLTTVTVSLKIDSPHFDPTTQTKLIRVSPSGDSEICQFLLVPQKSGQLRIMLEASIQDVYHSARVLRTTADATGVVLTNGMWVVTLPLFAGSTAISGASSPSIQNELAGHSNRPKSIMTKCDEGHFYDRSQNTNCPFCGFGSVDLTKRTVDDGGDTTVRFKAGMDEDRTRSYAPSAATGKSGSERGSVETDATVAVWQRGAGIDPVVGWLVCVAGSSRGRDYRIRSGYNNVGRDTSNHVCVIGDETITRIAHTRVFYDGEKAAFYVAPGSGRSSVYLNGKCVLYPTELKAYDVLELGATKLVFVPLCGNRFNWSETAELPRR